MSTSLNTLLKTPAVPLWMGATPVHDMPRLREALGHACPRLLIKRDDLIGFGGGGNKVRKMQVVAADAQAAGADALITCGGVQSNHARVTAAVGARLGMKVVLVANGEPPASLTGNARLDALFGAEVRYVPGREERNPAMEQAAADLRSAGRHPYIVPLGASTPAGTLGFARGVEELASARVASDAIVHATSSGGTQAGLILGHTLFGRTPEIIGVSADDPAASLSATIRDLIRGAAERIGARPESAGAGGTIEVDDTFVGGGYGVPTPASIEATELVARTEGIILDPVYGAKAMAGLISYVRAGRWPASHAVLFWHTGGVPGYFA